MEILEVKNLNINYIDKDNIVYSISNINFTLKKGTRLGIIGESGCGKSTIAKSILKILPRNTYIEGEVSFNGLNLLNINNEEMEKIRGKEISMIFQDPISSLNPVRKIKNQFYDILYEYKKEYGRKSTDKLIVRSLEQVNLKNIPGILNSYPFELSGGMAQRVFIAMAMIKEPKILIADEPTAAIDAINRKEILEQIKMLPNISVIIISHNIKEVYDICDEIIVINNGVIVEKGCKEEIFKRPRSQYTRELLKIDS